MAEATDVDQFSTYVNKMGVEITISLMTHTKSNILLSPPGIYSSLELLQMGASQKTKTELNSFLYGISGEVKVITPNQRRENGLVDGTTLWFSENAIFYSHNNMLLPQYKKIVEKGTSTLLLPLKTPDDIAFANTWVKDKTHNMIKSLLTDNEVGVDLLVASVNYFYGKWQEPFLTEMTRLEKFYCQDKSSSNVKMMERNGKYRYFEDQDYEMIELPYTGGIFSAIIIMPHEKIDISEILQNSNHFLKRFEESSNDLYGRIQLPLFTIDKEFTLKNVLSELGLNSIFSASQANFDNMFIHAKGIYVDDLKHHAVLQVNEKGTEAASLTNISFIGALPEPELNFNFVVNRPFIFLIRNKQINTLLYVAVIRYL